MEYCFKLPRAHGGHHRATRMADCELRVKVGIIFVLYFSASLMIAFRRALTELRFKVSLAEMGGNPIDYHRG